MQEQVTARESLIAIRDHVSKLLELDDDQFEKEQYCALFLRDAGDYGESAVSAQNAGSRLTLEAIRSFL